MRTPDLWSEKAGELTSRQVDQPKLAIEISGKYGVVFTGFND